MFRFIGRSPEGAKRVWGEGETVEEAHRNVCDAAIDYLKGRPDCRPLTLEQVPQDEGNYR